MAEKEKIVRLKLVGAKEADSELAKLQRTLIKVREDRKKLNKARKEGRISTSALAREQVKLNKKYTVASQKLRDMTKAQLRATGALRKARTVGDSVVTSLGRQAAGFIGIAVAIRVIGGAIKIFKDFQQANADLAAVLGKTRSEIGELTTDAKRLGASTSFTATQVSQLQKEFAKLGFSTSEILDATEATLALAAATGTDLARAAEVTGATVRAFGLDASETQRVVDVMAKSFSSSALDLEKFATAMSTLAPVAKNAGVNIEEATGFIGILADRGVDASTAGTALRNIFLDLSKSGLTMEQAFDKINNSTNKNATAMDLFGKRGATVANILAENVGQAEALTEALNDAGGAAQKMADEQLDTLQGKLTILNSAWEGLILSIEDGEGVISRAFESIVESATGILTKFTDINEVGLSGAIARDFIRSNEQALEFIKTLDELTKSAKEGGVARLKASEEIEKTIARQLSLFTMHEKAGSDTAAAINKALLNEAIKAQEEVTGVVDLALRTRLGLEIDFAKLTGIQLRVLKTQEAKDELERREAERLIENNAGLAARIKADQAEADQDDKHKEALSKEQEKANKAAIAAEKKKTDAIIAERKRLQALEIAIIKELDLAEINNIADDIEREKALRLFAFEQRIATLSEQKEFEAELIKELRIQLNEDLAEIDKQADDKAEVDVEAKRVKKITDEEADKQAKLEIGRKAASALNDLNEGILAQQLRGVEEGSAKEAAILKAASDRRKVLAIAEVGINLAKEISAINANAAANPSNAVTFGGAGIAQAAVLIGIAIASSAGQIAHIAAQTFKRGGIADSGGVLQGASHAQGGIPFSVGGRVGFEAEGGEAIINRRSTAMFRPQLSAINRAGGGISFGHGGVFQGGGINAPIQAIQAISGDAATLSEEGFEALADTLRTSQTSTRVINVVSDTTDAQNAIINTESEATFG